MQKRGYFFTLDVLIAMIVMVVGFVLIWAAVAGQPQVVQPYFLSQDIIDYLSTTTVGDMTSKQYVRNLTFNGNISTEQMELSLLEQIALFYTLNDTAQRPNDYVLKNFTKVVLRNATPRQYSFDFRLNGNVLYSQRNPSNRPQHMSDALSSAKTIVAVVVDKDIVSDPYIAEVRVWQ